MWIAGSAANPQQWKDMIVPQLSCLGRSRRGLRAGCVFSAALITLSPVLAHAQQTDPDRWFGRDKAAHFGVSAVLASCTYAVASSQFQPRYQPLVIAGGITLAVGGAKETFDALGFGDPSWKDLTWDVIGTIVGLGLAWGIDLAVRGTGHDAPPFGDPH